MNKQKIQYSGTLATEAFLGLLPVFSFVLQVNTQLGEFTLRRHTMETLPQEIEDQPDFQAVFGVAEDSSR